MVEGGIQGGVEHSAVDDVGQAALCSYRFRRGRPCALRMRRWRPPRARKSEPSIPECFRGHRLRAGRREVAACSVGRRLRRPAGSAKSLRCASATSRPLVPCRDGRRSGRSPGSGPIPIATKLRTLPALTHRTSARALTTGKHLDDPLFTAPSEVLRLNKWRRRVFNRPTCASISPTSRPTTCDPQRQHLPSAPASTASQNRSGNRPLDGV